MLFMTEVFEVKDAGALALGIETLDAGTLALDVGLVDAIERSPSPEE